MNSSTLNEKILQLLADVDESNLVNYYKVVDEINAALMSIKESATIQEAVSIALEAVDSQYAPMVISMLNHANDAESNRTNEQCEILLIHNMFEYLYDTEVLIDGTPKPTRPNLSVVH